MYGTGLLKGLGVTFKTFFKKPVTRRYPWEKAVVQDRFRGALALDPATCIACGLCEQACPNGVIKVSSVKDENNKRKLSGYTVDLQYCLFCGLCVEACPTKSLTHSHEFELADYNRRGYLKDLATGDKYVGSPAILPKGGR